VRFSRRQRPDLFALDGARLSALYEAHSVALLRFLGRRTADREIALDLLAETFAQAFVDRAKFRGSSEEEALAWIFGIARHQLANYYRRGEIEQRAVERLGVERPDWHPEDLERVEELVSLAETRRAVAARLAELPEDHRRAVELRVVTEREYPEIAAELGIKESLVRARVSRGLRTLARALEPERVEPAGEEAPG
jgi:RNA polymerase sigma-70 factor (ECF subfamily)